MSHPVGDEPTRPLPAWSPDGPDVERTEVLDVREPVHPQGHTPASGPASGPAVPPAAPAASRPLSEADVARRDPRGTPEWDLQMSRMANRPLTDLGLLLLRLCSLPMLLHGLHKAQDFPGLVETLRGNAVGALAPEIFAGLVIAGQVLLPILIAVGLLTRLSALALAALMGCVYVFVVLANNPVLDPRTGGLSGEATLAYVAITLPLFFTGAGRLSLGHALGARGRERRAERRVLRRLG